MKKEKALILNEISMTISSFAIQAMLYEVSSYPSPGLVSPMSNGAHRDMDYFTFIDSTSVLSKQNSDLNLNDRLVHTLIGIMGVCNDSTIIHRHNPQILEEVKDKARKIIEIGGMKTACGREKINNLCEEFIERNISPGGSADLLGVTVFLYLVEQYMSNKS